MEEIRYEAYKKLSLKAEQARLAKELLFDGQVWILSRTQGSEQWGRKILWWVEVKIEEDTRWQAKNIYINLIRQEDDTDEIMASGIITSLRVCRALKNNYADEVDELYSNHIRSAAHSSSKRSAYQDVCGLIRRYKTSSEKTIPQNWWTNYLSFTEKARLCELSKHGLICSESSYFHQQLLEKDRTPNSPRTI